MALQTPEQTPEGPRPHHEEYGSGDKDQAPDILANKHD
jgi:hypothetical protein